MNKIKILIVDDHAILRECIRVLLSFQDDFEIVDEAREGKESLEKARECFPDVVLMDLAMPGMDGLEATRQIRKENPKTKVVVLTQYEDKQYLLSAIEAGVNGYVSKKALSSELAAAIRIASRGDVFIPPSMTKMLIESCVQQNMSKRPDRLTARETQILTLVVKGRTSEEIAKLLQISLNTVFTHRMKIKKKLGLRNLNELIFYALSRGLLSVDA